MDTAKWPQDFIVKPMNEIVTNTCLKQPNPSSSQVERKTRPERDQALNCPRCNSLNTKFCYYNNYSLTQPRYFCKDCRRYWTEGGSLRNIPIGGGIRKNKRSSSSSSSKKSLFVNNTPQTLNPKVDEAKAQDLVFSQGFVNAPEVKDLNLAFSQGFGISTHPHHHHHHNNTLVSTSSALELLGISNTSSTSSSNTRPAFLPYPSHVQDPSVYTAAAAAAAAAEASGGFGMSYPQFQEFMRTPSSLGFSLDGGFGGDTLHQEEGSSNARPLFPFESLKVQVSSSSNNSGGKDNHSDNEQHERGGREEEGEGEGEAEQSVGFWNGMLGNGASAPTGNNNGSWQ